jgi:hypothetical protein
MCASGTRGTSLRGACSGPEGGAVSGEAAGLVPLKISPHEFDKSSGLDDLPFISFDQHSQNMARIKRLRKAVWLAGYLHNMHRPGHRPDVPWFVTLTYVGVDDWQADHVARAVDRYRRWCHRKGVPCRYTWVAELQDRGAVHYHLMIWLPVGVRMPKWDQSTTYRGRVQPPFWSHGMCNRQVAQSGIAYMMKYLSKMGKYHEFPRRCRTHASGGLDEHARLIRSWSNYPEWVKCSHGVGDVQRIGGKFVVLATGECLPPMYQRHFLKDQTKAVGMYLIPLRDPPPRLHDGPYSTWLPCPPLPQNGVIQ